MTSQPIACPKTTCRKPFPSRAALKRHIAAGCHNQGHIACTMCKPELREIARLLR